MSDFSLVGKILNADRSPAVGAYVRGFDHHELLGRDTQVGETITDAVGWFEIGFDESVFRGLWEKIAGSPHAYLTVSDPADRPRLTTSPVPMRWQIEFHIRLADAPAAPNAPDLYAQGLRRMTGALRDVGTGIQLERTLTQAHLANGRLEESVRRQEQAFLEGAEARSDQVNHLLALLDGVWSAYIEGTVFRTIGYDGPQVARNPWASDDAQVIAWPRSERFPWG